MKYILEYTTPKPIRAIGNTCTYGDISYTWKQIAMSDNKEALIKVAEKMSKITREKYRIVNWDNLEIEYES